MMGRNWCNPFNRLLNLQPLCRSIVSIGALFLLASCVTSPKVHDQSTPVAQPSSSPFALEAHLLSAEAVDGSLMIAHVKVPASTGPVSDSPQGEYENEKFPFFETTAAPSTPNLSGPLFREYEGIFAVPFNHAPGATVVRLTMGTGTLELPLKIMDGSYPSERLKAAGKYVNPRKSDLIRIKKDQAEVGKIYQRVTLKKYWQGPFVYPIESPITSVFGTKRVFNGEMKSFHGGLDLRAKEGTPIFAPAPGVVVLAKNLFYTGNTVMIDHGYGLITLYAHMSKIKIQVGAEVGVKTLLGLSGKTGRVSGPHLHWQVILHKNKVNPLDLIRVLK